MKFRLLPPVLVALAMLAAAAAPAVEVPELKYEKYVLDRKSVV